MNLKILDLVHHVGMIQVVDAVPGFLEMGGQISSAVIFVFYYSASRDS
jgi:hypothetical protein